MAFLDEFGHIGPFVSRTAPRFNESPVFGLAGILLPEESVRRFSTWFFQFKGHLFQEEIEASGNHPATWEKKGTRFFSPRSIRKSKMVRQAGFRLINKIIQQQGKIFYYGREKFLSPDQGNATGFYRTVLSASIRRIDGFCNEKDQNFLIIMDEHSDRSALIETAAKTMYGSLPARNLLEPPYEVESYLYQTVQAADWMSSIIGRIWNYRTRNTEFLNHEIVDLYFGERIDRASTHSSVFRRKPTQLPLI